MISVRLHQRHRAFPRDTREYCEMIEDHIAQGTEPADEIKVMEPWQAGRYWMRKVKRGTEPPSGFVARPDPVGFDILVPRFELTKRGIFDREREIFVSEAFVDDRPIALPFT